MKPIIMAGTLLVTNALVLYTIFIIKEHKDKRASKRVVSFITLGVFFDIVATICMIIGSSNTPFTLHGFLGYTSLLAMLIDAVLIWKHKVTFGSEKPFSRGLNIYSKIAFTTWVVLAYITGSILVIINRMSA